MTKKLILLCLVLAVSVIGFAAQAFSKSDGSYWIITNAVTKNFVVSVNGNVGIGTSMPTAKFHVVGLTTYADEATASANGLTTGAIYKTVSGDLKIKL